MHIIFINYSNYVGCSGVHIHFLAQTFTQLGIKCSVYIAGSPRKSKNYFGKSNYPIFNYTTVIEHIKTGYLKNCIIHAWTPREPCRKLTTYIVYHTNAPYFVHLEDNEHHIMEQVFKKPLLQLQYEALNNPTAFEKTGFCHPLYFQHFLNNARGVTCLIDKLEEHVPNTIPRMTFWPACEEFFFHLPPKAPKEIYSDLNISPNTTLLVYPGNIHRYNKDSMLYLLDALDLVTKEGYSIKLIKCGINSISLEELIPQNILQHIIDIGHIPAHSLAAYISCADILIQPGCPGNFDDYRFPSKIPFFLASGRPVILPKTNIGLKMTHKENCLLLEKGNAEEIAKNLLFLIKNPLLAKAIGKQGKQFARDSFSWKHSAKKLINFYVKCLSPPNAL